MANIEIEHRALVDKDKFDELTQFLNTHAEDLGQDNKDVYFFLYPDKLLKVSNDISKGTAKVVLKDKVVGDGNDFGEIEVPIDPQEILPMVSIFKHLGCTQAQRAYQERRNYRYKGVELAVKHSEAWEYHVELEIVITDRTQKTKAEAKIQAVADELGIKLMTDQELKTFRGIIDEKVRKGEYKNDHII